MKLLVKFRLISLLALLCVASSCLDAQQTLLGYGGGSTQFQLAHGQSFTLAGAGFGTKSRAVAPLIRDYATAAQGTIDAQWNSDHQPTTAGGNYNMQLQPTSFVSASGLPAGAPHPYVSKFYAGCHLVTRGAGANSTNGAGVDVSAVITAPAYPFTLRSSWYYRFDPGWQVDPGSDNNLKDLIFTEGNTVPFGTGSQNFFYTDPVATPGSFPISAISQGPSTAAVTTDYALAQELSVGQTVAVFSGSKTSDPIIANATVTAISGTGPYTYTLNTTALGGFPSYPITNITQANPGVVTVSTVSGSNPFSVDQWITFNNVGGMTEMNGLTANNVVPPLGGAIFVTAVGGSSGAWTATFNVDTSAFTAYTSGGEVTLWRLSGGVNPGNTNMGYGTDGGAQGMFQNPTDNNGHSTAFWGSMLSPLHAANGWIKREVEMCVTNQTGSTGFVRVYDNSVLIMNYSGATDLPGGVASSGFFNWAMGNFSRDGGPQNYRYYTDALVDISATGVTGNVGTVFIGNASTFDTSTIREPQVADTWATGSIHIPSVWKGALPGGGSNVWFHVRTEAGTTVTVGPYTMQSISPLWKYALAPRPRIRRRQVLNVKRRRRRPACRAGEVTAFRLRRLMR